MKLLLPILLSAITLHGNELMNYQRVKNQPAKNLIQDAGFEEKSSCWKNLNAGGWKIVSGAGRNGSSGLVNTRRNPNDYVLLTQQFDLKPDTAYVFGGWIRTENLSGRGAARRSASNGAMREPESGSAEVISEMSPAPATGRRSRANSSRKIIPIRSNAISLSMSEKAAADMSRSTMSTSIPIRRNGAPRFSIRFRKPFPQRIALSNSPASSPESSATKKRKSRVISAKSKSPTEKKLS